MWRSIRRGSCVCIILLINSGSISIAGFIGNFTGSVRNSIDLTQPDPYVHAGFDTSSQSPLTKLLNNSVSLKDGSTLNMTSQVVPFVHPFRAWVDYTADTQTTLTRIGGGSYGVVGRSNLSENSSIPFDLRFGETLTGFFEAKMTGYVAPGDSIEASMFATVLFDTGTAPRVSLNVNIQDITFSKAGIFQWGSGFLNGRSFNSSDLGAGGFMEMGSTFNWTIHSSNPTTESWIKFIDPTIGGFNPAAPQNVPEPASWLLVSSGLIGIIASRRRVAAPVRRPQK